MIFQTNMSVYIYTKNGQPEMDNKQKLFLFGYEKKFK